MVRRCCQTSSAWVSYYIIRIIVGQGPIVLAVGAGGGCLDIIHHLSLLFSFSLSLGDAPISTKILSQRVIKPKTTNQPTFLWSIWRNLLCWYFNGKVEMSLSTWVRILTEPSWYFFSSLLFTFFGCTCISKMILDRNIY